MSYFLYIYWNLYNFQSPEIYNVVLFFIKVEFSITYCLFITLDLILQINLVDIHNSVTVTKKTELRSTFKSVGNNTYWLFIIGAGSVRATRPIYCLQFIVGGNVSSLFKCKFATMCIHKIRFKSAKI